MKNLYIKAIHKEYLSITVGICNLHKAMHKIFKVDKKNIIAETKIIYGIYRSYHKFLLNNTQFLSMLSEGM